LYVVLRRVQRVVDSAQGHAEAVRTTARQMESEQRARLERQNAELRTSHEAVESQVRSRTAELSRERVKLERLIRLGIAMVGERNQDILLQSILDTAMEISGADGGTFYAVSDAGGCEFRIVRNRSLNIHLGGTSGRPPSFPPVRLRDAETGQPNRKNVVSVAVLDRHSLNIPDVYESAEFDFSGTRRFDDSMKYRSQSFLTVPLIPLHGEVIGAMQLINAIDPTTGETIAFSDEIQAFVETLAAQAAVAIDNQTLQEAQRILLDSFVQLIASAIDAKSPYTGGHCARVPELAKLLAEAANARTEGPFADFSINTDDEWREFRIGALLHDCGKVTTPEYVVDKAVKLETIYNRIHEIRTRFEVLWRDAEIDYWRERVLGQKDPSLLGEEKETRQQQLQEDFAFVAECNLGTERMIDQRKVRLSEIAAQRWIRYFDDEAGLSESEKMLRPNGHRPPPAEETLLADRPEHIVPRGNPNPFGDNPHGFKINVPQHLYNHGEMYNLSIAQGTLTAEERFKINEHVIQTIQMLTRLPWPRSLVKIPEYAGAHHEAVNGTGYPRRLTRDQMSVGARMITIADV
ncbi:MAG: HD-GYP domain-containing protein, partial [Alphaproteobacteria bacterium]